MVHLYTGYGKGKTTAAVGLAVRAKGAGESVCFVQFLKGGCASSEIRMLKKLKIRTIRLRQRHPAFYKKESVAELKKRISRGLKKVKRIILSRKYDLVVLDEVLTALNDKLTQEKQLLDIIKINPRTSELVLTGLSSTGRISRVSDYVSYVKKTKHPFDRGIMARKGIEF